ncbi:MAG TPA: FAD:protein FMN transferase [Candidatus Paceibacterota bacterium]|nr:FAD:protein FMN transferase [Candidatus Paceibacterota bacterium]
MKETRAIMGMPITVEVIDEHASPNILEEVFSYFTSVDEKFSTYKDTSEISKINEHLREKSSLEKVLGSPRKASARPFSQEVFHSDPEVNFSSEMQEVLELAEKTKQETGGYFNIKKQDGTVDPSGIVKGWAINNAADILLHCGASNFCIEAGGDIQTHGNAAGGAEWSVGIRNPFNTNEIVKVIYPHGKGVATSGSYERGNHIYNPLNNTDTLEDIVSITVIGPNVLEADRFATAAFAMGKEGVNFIESLPQFDAYSIDKFGVATMTRNFKNYLQ